MKEKKTKSEEIHEKMLKERGYHSERWEFLAMNDPDFGEAYNNIYSLALNAGKALSLVEREMIACGILCYRGKTRAVKTHMIRAIKHGATRRQLLEAVETCLVPGGAPTMSTGLEGLMLALKECEEKGIEVK